MWRFSILLTKRHEKMGPIVEDWDLVDQKAVVQLLPENALNSRFGTEERGFHVDTPRLLSYFPPSSEFPSSVQQKHPEETYAGYAIRGLLGPPNVRS